jgi:uncharacterized protein involved in exopolysaccharide biosynthesis
VILRSRAGLFGAVAGFCILGALAYGLLAKDRYEAAATLIVDPGALEASAGAGRLRATDLDLLRSERVAQRVVENEHLAEDPGMRRIYMESVEAGRPPLEALAHAISRELDASTTGDGTLVRSSVTASEPGLAVRIANAYAQAWGEVMLELRSESIRNGMERAHQELVALRARLGEARARVRDASELTRAAQQAEEEFAQLSRLATSAVRQAAAGETSGDGRGGFQAQIETDADLLAAPGELSLRPTAIEASLRPAAATSPSAEDDIRLAQQSLEHAEERLARLSADGVGAPFPVHLLVAARPPEASSKPGVAACAIIGLAAGLVLGLLGIVLAEIVDRRVRRPSDLTNALGVVVLGTLPAVAPHRSPTLPTLRARRTAWLRASGGAA